MSLSNYGDLQGAISDWLARDDLASRLPDFITLAESRMQSELDTTDSEESYTITGVADQALYPLPDDYKSIRAVTGETSTGRYPINYRTPVQFADENRLNTGLVSIYTIKGTNIELGPAPSDGELVYIDYIARFAPLTDNNTTNWLLTNFPNVYLYGSIAEASAYDRNAEAEAKWLGRFMEAMPSVRQYIANQRFSGAPLVIRAD